MRSLVISRHDFRSAGKANIHFISSELARRGPTRFLSIGFSHLSLLRGDLRVAIETAGSTPVLHDGVECLLWRTAWHPISLGARLAAVERKAIERYLRLLPGDILAWIDEADMIVIESGLPVIMAGLIRARRPDVWLVYNASDDLRTIGAAAAIVEMLDRDFGSFDLVRLPSRLLAPLLPESDRTVVIPHGICPTVLSAGTVSPYGGGRHVVSLGSMLFDRTFFEIAAPRFPDVTFHVIGAGPGAAKLRHDNVRVYPPMRHADTIAYIRHADVGVAPYREAGRAAYLADSSMKLRQFAAFGLPSVCTAFACGGEPSRIPYLPSDEASIVGALTRALDCGRVPANDLSSWSDVVDGLVPGARARQIAASVDAGVAV